MFLIANKTPIRRQANAATFSDFYYRRERKGKNIFKKLKNAKSRAGRLRNHKDGEALPALVSSQSKVASEEEEEAESRDMMEAEQELDRSSLEVLSQEAVGGLAVLSSATFCCGGQETERKEILDPEKCSVNSQNAGVNYVCLINVLLSYWHSLYSGSVHLLVPRRTSSGSLGGWMFVRLRVQSPSGKKKSSSRTLPRRDAWLALSQER